MAWHFWIDRGGTFTDIIGRAPDGALHCRKVLSQQAGRSGDAGIIGMRDILGIARDAPFPANAVTAIKIGTTVATNALLERKGEPTVFAVTRGFADVLRIGTQHRPRLFDLDIKLPSMLYATVVEIDERVSASGDIITALDEANAALHLRRCFADGFRAVAIAFAHGYRFPAHEARVAALAQEIGFTQVSVSHVINPMIKLVPRGDTTVCDAYLSPVVGAYVRQFMAEVGGARVMFMQSNGGLADGARLRGKDAVLSGPAGGVVGCVETARACGFPKIIGFDMGGTSTDVAHYAGTYDRTFDTVVAGVRLRAPMVKLDTVAAGGGSICRFDGLSFRVGPESAGADPGPACYRRGGPLTITDCNVLLGRIRPEAFPKTFGPTADQPIDCGIVRQLFDDMARKVAAATGRTWSAEEIAEGFIRIAVDNVARAIRKISVAAGYDPRDYVLSAFGGAGGQHACRVAAALGMSRVVIHPLAGALSALGIGLSRPRTIREKTLSIPLRGDTLPTIERTFGELAVLAAADVPPPVTITRLAHLRSEGVDSTLAIAFGALEDMRAGFTDAHRRRYGFAPTGSTIICETIEVEAVGAADTSISRYAPEVVAPAKPAAPVFIDGQWIDVPCIARGSLMPGARIAGPAILTEALATTVIEAGWDAHVQPDFQLVLTRTGGDKATAATTARDPVTLELFNNLFMSIAERMGASLQNTARSVNIKERLDFSCALFDADGNLIANAPHIPVHLGSMGDSVRAVREARGADTKAGTAFAINAPYKGGTHLPDITVVTPVVLSGCDRVRFYVASRGHHADVGGVTPGSMPPHSRTVAEEGVLFDSVQIVREDQFLEREVAAILAGGPYPARDPATNIADLKAQCAANAAGAAELAAICERYGADVVDAYMAHVQDYAEEAVRRAIGKLRSGAFTCPMDNGSQIKVRIDIDTVTRTATIDFAGSSPQTENNFNAPASVCRSAVLYAFRTLVDEDIPLNEGCLRPITLIIPPRSILNPEMPAAVVAGNVETSQIICDAIFGALGVIAASQGTMNNLTFGDARRQYYETIAGGAGAGPNFDGASAVQTHMTNSRLTDVEVLEARFPVTLERFEIRRGSGGHGAHRGGDGVRRVFRFNEPMTAAILSGRRATSPFGLNGGGPGDPGRTTHVRADGREETLTATAEANVAVGDRLMIETPGGGGYGKTE